MIRDEAREYFKSLNLSYDNININSLYQLCKILNKHISQSDREILIMINEPIVKGKNRNIIFKDGKLEFAEIRVRGTYFADREAITFNRDGFIGFCGWADQYNSKVFVDAFFEWCDYLNKK